MTCNSESSAWAAGSGTGPVPLAAPSRSESGITMVDHRALVTEAMVAQSCRTPQPGARPGDVLVTKPARGPEPWILGLPGPVARRDEIPP